MDAILKKNLTYLFFLQNVNYVVPLILLPYLSQTLGAANFGKIAFAQAFITYFILITDYGFNTTSTQKVVAAKNNKQSLSIVFWSTTATKLFFAIVSFSILAFLILWVPKLGKMAPLLFVASIGIVTSLLFPIWLFQGLEKMSFITWINVIPRIAILAATLLYVKQESDYLLALTLQVGGALIGALVSTLLIVRMRVVRFYCPTVEDIKHYIVDGWHIFISGIATNFYTTTNIVVLGFLTNDTWVGLFSAADKIVRAITSLLSSVSQVTFPRINTYYHQSREKAIEFASKLLSSMAVITLAGGLLLLIFAPFIVKLLFGLPQYSESIAILQISSFLPFLTICNGIIAVNLLITFGLKKRMFFVVAIGGIFSLLLIAPLVMLFQARGVAFSALLTELLIAFLLLNELSRNKIGIHFSLPKFFASK